MISSLLLAATLAPAAQALSPVVPEPEPWTVQVDPLTFALGFAHVQIERRLAPSWSLYAGPHLRLFDGIITEGHEPYTGAGVEVGLRWFPKGRAPTGTWLQVRTVAAYAWSEDPVEQSGFAGYSSVLGGYSGVVGDWLVLAGGLGVQRLYYTLGDYGVEGWLPAAHTAVGVTF